MSATAGRNGDRAGSRTAGGTLQRLLSKHAEVMTRDEKQVVKTKAQELAEVLEAGDPVEMRSCAHELAEATEPVLRKVIGKSLETLLR